jgi:hypothetical protein
MCPKSLTVIELKEMTEFMHHHIINKFTGYECKTIIKIEIAFRGATPPPRTLVADCNPLWLYANEWCPI